MVNFSDLRRDQLANHSPHLHVVPLGSFQICSDAKEKEWGTERNEKLLHLFIPSKTATLVPEFAVKGMPLGRTL